MFGGPIRKAEKHWSRVNKELLYFRYILPLSCVPLTSFIVKVIRSIPCFLVINSLIVPGSFYISWIPTHLKLKAPLPSGIFFLTYCSNTELCKAFPFVSSYSFTEASNTLSIFLVLSMFWCDIHPPGNFRAHYDSIYRSLSVYDTIIQHTTGSQLNVC